MREPFNTLTLRHMSYSDTTPYPGSHIYLSVWRLLKSFPRYTTELPNDVMASFAHCFVSYCIILLKLFSDRLTWTYPCSSVFFSLSILSPRIRVTLIMVRIWKHDGLRFALSLYGWESGRMGRRLSDMF